MIRTAHTGMRAQRGFVLVGVALFVLVLTILGLSLFSLSGFESQFLVRTVKSSRAFHAAAGGIERARFALISTEDLGSVRSNLPRDGVEYAVAIQNDDPTADDTTGAIKWDGDDIWVRVRARDGDARVVLQAKFEVAELEDYYKRLFTGIHLFVPTVRRPQAFVSGAVAQYQNGDQTWQSGTPSDLPRPPIDQRPTMPLANLASLWGARYATAEVADDNGNNGRYKLDARGVFNNLKFFKTPEKPPGDWNVHVPHPDPVIEVGGVAVWMVEAGAVGCMWFEDRVTVTALNNDPTARLIIAARTQNDIPEINPVIFASGIRSGTGPGSGVPIIIVTPGIVSIGSGQQYDKPSTVGYLSIYAGRLTVDGPAPAYGETHLWHLPSLTGAPDVIMDALYDLNFLPNSSVGSGTRLALVPGSWQILASAN